MVITMFLFGFRVALLFSLEEQNQPLFRRCFVILYLFIHHSMFLFELFASSSYGSMLLCFGNIYELFAKIQGSNLDLSSHMIISLQIGRLIYKPTERILSSHS